MSKKAPEGQSWHKVCRHSHPKRGLRWGHKVIGKPQKLETGEREEVSVCRADSFW